MHQLVRGQIAAKSYQITIVNIPFNFITSPPLFVRYPLNIFELLSASTIKSPFLLMDSMESIQIVHSSEGFPGTHLLHTAYCGWLRNPSPKGWLKPVQNHEMFTIYQRVQEFAPIHMTFPFPCLFQPLSSMTHPGTKKKYFYGLKMPGNF